MEYFYGFYEHQLDDKGRFRVPPTLRKKLGDEPVMFCNSEDGCVVLYTKEGFDRFVKKRFDAIDLMDADEVVKLQREIFSSFNELKEDKQGRASLSSHFIEECEMSKDIVTIGSQDRIEIWDKARFKKYLRGELKKKSKSDGESADSK